MFVTRKRFDREITALQDAIDKLRRDNYTTDMLIYELAALMGVTVRTIPEAAARKQIVKLEDVK